MCVCSASRQERRELKRGPDGNHRAADGYCSDSSQAGTQRSGDHSNSDEFQASAQFEPGLQTPFRNHGIIFCEVVSSVTQGWWHSAVLPASALLPNITYVCGIGPIHDSANPELRSRFT